MICPQCRRPSERPYMSFFLPRKRSSQLSLPRHLLVIGWRAFVTESGKVVFRKVMICGHSCHPQDFVRPRERVGWWWRLRGRAR